MNSPYLLMEEKCKYRALAPALTKQANILAGRLQPHDVGTLSHGMRASAHGMRASAHEMRASAHEMRASAHGMRAGVYGTRERQNLVLKRVKWRKRA